MSSIKQDLIEIKAELIDRRNELEEKLRQLSSEKISDDEVQDPGDQALSSTMETLHNSLQDTELAEYNRIVRALEKVDDGTYGICSDCGSPIAEKRLQSYPNAERCLGCQETFEDQRS